MTAIGTIAAVIAAAGVLLAIRERRRARLTELVDVLTDIKASVDRGAADTLAGLDGRLQTGSQNLRLAERLRLSRTRELADGPLRSGDKKSSESITAAISSKMRR